jgi:hypothetical protein
MQPRWFNPDASANELGLYERVGAQITCVPDPVYSIPVHLLRQIHREIDPAFRPLWVNILWKSPNGGVVRTGHHLIARHVLHPIAGAPVIKGLLLPTTNLYGIEWRQPILIATVLDGLSDQERNRGVLPRYVPFDARIVKSMKYAMWRRNNVSANERANQNDQAEQEAERRVKAEIVAGVTERKKDELLRIKRAMGKADYVYVSDKKGAA